MILRLFYLKILFFINISLIFCTSVVYDKCEYVDTWTFTKTKTGATNGWTVTVGYYTPGQSWTKYTDHNNENFWIHYREWNKGDQRRLTFNDISDLPYFRNCEKIDSTYTVKKEFEWTNGCVSTTHMTSTEFSWLDIIFEKKGESCSEGYIEYEWNNNEWIKIQCATDDECNGNDPNKCDKNNLEFIIIIIFFFIFK